MDICYALLNYRPLNGNDDIEKGSIIQFASVDACVATVLTCFEKKEKRSGHTQKMYAYNLTGHVS